MNRMELIVPCHFGLEAVVKREIQDLGYEISSVEDGRVTFYGDPEAIAYANIFLRSAERVLLKIGQFEATSFEELFEKTRDLPWEDYIPEDGKFWVKKAYSVKSRLFSTSDIQSIMKKAMVERLKEKYHLSWFEETGVSFPLRVSIMKDVVTVAIDTTGAALHKRGYRKESVIAPISETMAASLIMLTPWKKDRILVDPLCGSGTFPIEAAMMAADIAPGMNREFLSQTWKHLVPRKHWYQALDEANERIKIDTEVDIQGYDIDGKAAAAAKENAMAAGVTSMIHFQKRPLSELNHPKKYGFLISNPPYGERIGENEEMPKLYREIGEAYKRLDDWSMYLITGYEDAEKYIGRKADKNRKLYNGMIKSYFYQFMGSRPPKKR